MADVPDVYEGREPATAAFWRELQDGRFALPWCDACARPFFWPRRWCPRCGDESAGLRPAASAGTVWALSEVALPFFGLDESEVPYRVALVDLDAGVRLVARLAAGTLAIGDRVVLDGERSAAESRLFFVAAG